MGHVPVEGFRRVQDVFRTRSGRVYIVCALFKSTTTFYMFLVGLTGGIASGKSTVSSQLRGLGCPVIDADVVARKGYRYVILDVPLLFETRSLTHLMKHTVVVYCDPATQLARLMQRDSLSREEAEQRIAAQMPLSEKRGLARHVIENSSSREDTHRQVLRLHTALEDSMEYLPIRAVAMAAVAGLGGLILYMVNLLTS
ncbi:dephospho-CoA kinase domain-containing protein isoform X2 [Tachysurus fulvidraco]|uniref:dephospho-CoA kinase domain-containing protein isoform X2 n=1 Tax=Tachysurus fulvidraco TaxID=1234273 RepID=UPI001FEFB69D|nr:dephospho-CoA kinase domain-containing protein isoform X2 [Tachysurus fulvidraco]